MGFSTMLAEGSRNISTAESPGGWGQRAMTDNTAPDRNYLTYLLKLSKN